MDFKVGDTVLLIDAFTGADIGTGTVYRTDSWYCEARFEGGHAYRFRQIDGMCDEHHWVIRFAPHAP